MIKQAGTIVKLQGSVTEQGALIAVLTTTASTAGHSWIFSVIYFKQKISQ